MAVKLRLRRLGRTHHPVYQIIAADGRSPRDGKYLERIGSYDPHQVFGGVKIDHNLALKWLRVGAQPTDTVRSILSDDGVMLKLHLLRKGKSEDEIRFEFEKWAAQRDAKDRKTKDAHVLKQKTDAEGRMAHEKKVREQRTAKIQAKLAAPKEPVHVAESE